MFRAIYDDDLIFKWVMERTPYPQKKGFEQSPPAIRGIGYEIDGILSAGFIFYNHATWNKSIEVGVALDTKSPVLRAVLRDVMKYPFEQLKCERVTAYVPKRAKECRKLVQGIGFVEEGNVRLGFGTDDCMVYGLLKREAQKKWKYAD